MTVLIRDVFDDEDVLDLLDHLYKECSDYLAVHGMAQRWAAEETLLQIQMDPDRRLFGVFMPNKTEMLGAVEVKIDYPSIGALTIGWMLITPSFREKGIGCELLHYIELRAVNDWNITEIFVNLSKYECRAESFLIKNGFINTGKQQMEKREGKEFTVTLFEKHINQGSIV